MIRRTAIATLGQMGPTAQSAIPALVKLVHDKDAAVRQKAIYALTGIGQDSIPTLANLSQHKDKQVRLDAIKALSKLGPAGNTALKVFLKDKLRSLRILAAEAAGTHDGVTVLFHTKAQVNTTNIIRVATNLVSALSQSNIKKALVSVHKDHRDHSARVTHSVLLVFNVGHASRA